MNVIATPYSLLLLVSAGLVLAFALLAWRRSFRGRTVFILLMFAVAEWCVLSAVSSPAPQSRQLKATARWSRPLTSRGGMSSMVLRPAIGISGWR